MNREGIEILLVEDSPADVELTLHALRKNALVKQVHVARDGEEALDFLYCRDAFQGRAREPLPGLILLDLKLPKVDGLSVLRTLKNDRRMRAIPVIVLTSSKEEKDLARSYEFGVNSYIQKPVDFDRFCATVNELGHYWLLVNQAPPQQILNALTEKSG
jgi:two-component system response regulator